MVVWTRLDDDNNEEHCTLHNVHCSWDVMAVYTYRKRTYKICTNHSLHVCNTQTCFRLTTTITKYRPGAQKFAFCNTLRDRLGFDCTSWQTRPSQALVSLITLFLTVRVLIFNAHSNNRCQYAFHCGRHCTTSRGRRHPVPFLPQQYRQSKQQLRSVLLFVIQPKVSQLVSSQYSKFKPRLSATVYRNFRRCTDGGDAPKCGTTGNFCATTFMASQWGWRYIGVLTVHRQKCVKSVVWGLKNRSSSNS